MPNVDRELARRYFEEIINLRHLHVCTQIITEEYTEHAVAPFDGPSLVV